MSTQFAVEFTPIAIESILPLFEQQNGPCVSIYLPTARTGKEIRESPIRLKNRITEAEEQLEAADVDSSTTAKTCQRVMSLCDLESESNREFWQHQGDGLAVLIDEDSERFFKLPSSPEELTIVANRFHLKPLLRAVNRDEEYCVLAVSQSDVRFLEGSRDGLAQRPIEELPESLQAVIRGDHIKGFGLHSFNVRPGAGDAAVPHGHVDSNEQHELRRYFNAIDEALQEVLKGDTRPLIFAGVKELFPFFRDTTEYGFLEEEPIAGNPDESSAEELHEKAWPMITKRFSDRQEEAIERFHTAASSNLAERELESVLVAAHDGRIETLLVKTNATRWGTYDADERIAKVEREASAANCDLVDLATVKTFEASGTVVFVDEGALGDDQVVGAICRFPVK